MMNIDECEFNELLSDESNLELHLKLYPETTVTLDNGQKVVLVRAEVYERMMRELDQFEADHYNRQIGCIDCHD